MVPTFYDILAILQEDEKAILYLLEKNIFMLFLADGIKPKQLCLITSHSPSTITSIMRYLRKMVGASLDFEDYTIGGQNIKVEIDDSKLGKNKYHRGHLVSGA
ncbi:hypothetical protein RF11_13868 [Thelohanellus kitauei]|uniref:Uncharacterized protein n=1 Tax=Thelohanellus kitauei TaxID=669202 RepID=A0A0C2N024_THEKT|nr:hypothetical protein RF11_13868 [Thelohanellus kitauei]